MSWVCKAHSTRSKHLRRGFRRKLEEEGSLISYHVRRGFEIFVEPGAPTTSTQYVCPATPHSRIPSPSARRCSFMPRMLCLTVRSMLLQTAALRVSAPPRCFNGGPSGAPSLEALFKSFLPSVARHAAGRFFSRCPAKTSAFQHFEGVLRLEAREIHMALLAALRQMCQLFPKAKGYLLYDTYSYHHYLYTIDLVFTSLSCI